MKRATAIRMALTAAVLLGGGVASPAQAPQLAALRAIEPGLWQLKEAGSTGPGRLMCVADPTVLLQLRHPHATCSRLVLADSPSGATIHYVCPGAGRGRTTITVETARLFQLETQGIADGAPFDLSYEARRQGDCAGATPPAQ